MWISLAPYERVCNASVQSFPNQVDGHIYIYIYIYIYI